MEFDNPMANNEDSKMLADIKPEIKPKIKLDPIKKRSVQSPIIVQQQQPLVNEPTCKIPQITKFGWTTAYETLISLPFVSKDSDCYVAKKIFESKFLNNIKPLVFVKIFQSDEYIRTREMSQSDADTFNEINIAHCDKELAGNYLFKAKELMLNLKDIKSYIVLLKAYFNSIESRQIENDLFGFVKIANENDVPFIWSEGKQLVPLFYFEGQSEYLNQKSICVTDKWKCLYLKVVDLEDVKKLFSRDTTFTISWPEDGYDYGHLLSVEFNITNNSTPVILNHQIHHPLRPDPAKAQRGQIYYPPPYYSSASLTTIKQPQNSLRHIRKLEGTKTKSPKQTSESRKTKSPKANKKDLKITPQQSPVSASNGLITKAAYDPMYQNLQRFQQMPNYANNNNVNSSGYYYHQNATSHTIHWHASNNAFIDNNGYYL